MRKTRGFTEDPLIHQCMSLLFVAIFVAFQILFTVHPCELLFLTGSLQGSYKEVKKNHEGN